MRRPFSLWRDLGAWRFLGFNIVLLAAVLGYLALPFLWAVALLRLGFELEPALAIWAEIIGAVAAASLPAIAASAFLGLRRRHGPGASWRWIAALPAYWPLGAAAAYLAVWELVTQPFKWRKTAHGVGRIADRMRAEALRRLSQVE